jgi:hypothetical protein
VQAFGKAAALLLLRVLHSLKKGVLLPQVFAKC